MTTPPNPTSPVPPGWFPIPGDPSQERWWDGRQWTPHVRGTQMLFGPNKKRKLGWGWIMGIALLGLVMIGAVIGIVNIPTQPSSAASSTPSRTTTRRTISPEEQAQINAQNKAIADGNAVDSAAYNEQKSMTDKGWSYMSDHLYYTIAPAGSVTCGTTRCAGFSVVSLAPSGCPGGILLEASFLASGNVSVGQGSSITAALTEGQQAVFKLYDYSRSGTGVQVTSMRCM